MNKFLQLSFLFCSLNLFSQPGSLDQSFGDSGKVITSITDGSDKAYGVALQSDGKIVVAGMNTSTLTGKDFLCIRYNSDGTLDSSFGTNGIFTYDVQIGSEDVAYSIALQSDGKIILAGYSDDGSNKNAALVRLNLDGSLDTTFGISGKVITDFITNRADEIKVVKIHSLTGNIVVGGTSALTSTNSQIAIARYNSSGVLDSTFGNSGIATIVNSGIGAGTYSPVIEDLVVKSNGKITAVGWYEQQNLNWSANYYTCRLNSNGTFDSTYSSDGISFFNGSFNGNDKAFSLLLNSDDSFIMGGSGNVSSQNYAFTLIKITNSGTLATPTFENQISIGFNGLHTSMNYDLELDLTGKYISVGSTGTSNSKQFAITRVNPNFTLDLNFGTSGRVTTSFGSNSINEAYDSVIQSDNKIVVVGYSGNDIALARYNGEALSIDEFEENKSITIYPNPAKSELNVNFNYEINDYNYKIYDISGKLIISGELNFNMNSINTENLSKGLYVLKIDNKNVKFLKE